jgi:hypothetical protein
MPQLALEIESGLIHGGLWVFCSIPFRAMPVAAGESAVSTRAGIRKSEAAEQIRQWFRHSAVFTLTLHIIYAFLTLVAAFRHLRFALT